MKILFIILYQLILYIISAFVHDVQSFFFRDILVFINMHSHGNLWDSVKHATIEKHSADSELHD